MPALVCEERERGMLLAQMLSPAAPREILAARFLFYPVLGAALGALLAGIFRPVTLTRAFFWLSLAITATGYMGVGSCIASLARTPRRASLAALSYMLTVALIVLITQRYGIPSFQYLTLEFYAPRIVHAAIDGTNVQMFIGNLIAAGLLAIFWCVLAIRLFRRHGWQ
jgi:hypothetical protein